MFVKENEPDVHVHAEIEDALTLDRTDIHFEDLTHDTVRISVRIHNHGPRRSRPTTVRLESAPLGAFVPWQPLINLPLPPIEPGESRVVNAVVARPGPLPAVAVPAAVPAVFPEPARDIGFETALRQWIQERRSRWEGRQCSPIQKIPAMPGAQAAAPGQLRRGERQRMAAELRRQVMANRGRRGAVLAMAPWDMEPRQFDHWVGNINVFVGNRPAVERHMAKGTRIYPGKVNMALFEVGGGFGPGRPGGNGPDAFSFQLKGPATEWNAALHPAPNIMASIQQPPLPPMEQGRWVETAKMMYVSLRMNPPADCGPGELEVHVTRRSCGTTAIVEFEFDPTAKGPGCHHT